MFCPKSTTSEPSPSGLGHASTAAYLRTGRIGGSAYEDASCVDANGALKSVPFALALHSAASSTPPPGSANAGAARERL